MAVAAMRSLGADGHGKSADGRFCQATLRGGHIQVIGAAVFLECRLKACTERTVSVRCYPLFPLIDTGLVRLC